MNSYKTDQENFWAGDFGDAYASRNTGQQFLANQIAFFEKILARTRDVKSVIELGANIGMNLLAIRQLLSSASLTALEINKSAAEKIKNIVQSDVTVLNETILDFKPKQKWDFVLAKGVLIHLNPEELGKVYQLMYNSSNRYICLGEYYNPKPVSVSYRGHENRLFKRDFCGEMLDAYPSLTLRDYGFVYHRDPLFPQDDITWFLLEKN